MIEKINTNTKRYERRSKEEMKKYFEKFKTIRNEKLLNEISKYYEKMREVETIEVELIYKIKEYYDLRIPKEHENLKEKLVVRDSELDELFVNNEKNDLLKKIIEEIKKKEKDMSYIPNKT